MFLAMGAKKYLCPLVKCLQIADTNCIRGTAFAYLFTAALATAVIPTYKSL